LNNYCCKRDSLTLLDGLLTFEKKNRFRMYIIETIISYYF